MGKPGRNDPCPCGSGKKYKKCCLEVDAAKASPGPEVQSLRNQIREMLEGQSFGSIEEVNTFLQGQMGKMNRMPNPDFEGLSPEQVNGFLYQTFDSPNVVAYPTVLPLSRPGRSSSCSNVLLRGSASRG